MNDQSSEPGSADREGLSRRRALGYGGALVAGAAASQILSDSASAAEATSHRGSVEMHSVSLAQANELVRAGVRYVQQSKKRIPPMFILVVDACGEEKASQRMDGNGPASVTLVPLKARTARAFRTATVDLARQTTDPARIASFTTAGFSLLGGGRPIREEEGGEVIGAIAVGGGTPEQDDEVAQAALRSL
jgi:glc operon protein GlcG